MKKSIFISFLIFSIILVNCTYQQITLKKELNDLQGVGPIHVTTKDKMTFTFTKFNFDDKNISGLCYLKNDKSKNQVDTTFAFENIESINRWKINFLKTFVVLPAVIFVTAGVIEIINGSSFTIERIEPGNSGSCPFVYSGNGEDFILEGESFGTALGRKLETETMICMPNIRDKDGLVSVKITNERPETHFFNKIELFAAEIDPNYSIFSDNDNNLRVVKNLKQISNAVNLNKDITKMLKQEDNIYWESDLSTANKSNNFEDKIELTLNNNSSEDSLSLIVSAINTDISGSVFEYLSNILGSEYLNFTKAAESDPEMIGILKETLKRAALKIDIWDGNNWIYQKMIYPEANSVKFKKVVKLPNKPNLKLRLRCMTDVWRIDAINFDDEKEGNFYIHKPQLAAFETNGLGNSHDIESDDSNYLKLLPEQNIIIQYKSVEPNAERKISYFTKVKGYLYEWIIDYNGKIGQSLAQINPETEKIQLLKFALKDMDNFLPVIYENWKTRKTSTAFK